jgi:predicted ATPase
MREGLRKWQAVGAGLNWPYFLALLAGAYGRAGRTDEGLRCLEEALGRVAANGERLYEAELYRLQGELLHKVGPGGPHSPEACFEKAIEVARRQGAVLWELRARIGLCRLWQKQGRVPEAQHLLAAIYGRFNEGFDTQDLQEAQTLLIDLGDKCLNGSNFS